ncbi:MAG: DUF2520 domain-containing protein [Bacteroides sp.]|nr:DUF2520 domain-containing protein [Bacteroides sp.]
MLHERSVVLVGAGNVATGLGCALHRRGIPVSQVFSRTQESAQALAVQIGAEAVSSWELLRTDADLYIVSLPDEVLTREVSRIAAGREQALLVHTAGSVPMQVWEGYATRYGVLYPLQTFSKAREIDLSRVPLFIEANSPQDTLFLREWAGELSEQVYEADSAQRKALHLSAVFACNFVNHLYAIANEWLERHGLPFEALLPLIDETARKVHAFSPRQAQTGPAVRHDETTIQAHLKALEGRPGWQQLYESLSRDIQDMERENQNTSII